MYSYIKGELADIEDGKIIIETGGIGYNIFVPGSVMDEMPSLGEQIKIYTYLNVKEDAMTLFGFLSKDDLTVFKLLLGVNGIGPKGALAILSVMTTDDLRFAVISGDAKTISKAPGIGSKTAQRVILELKDKLHIEDVLETGTQTIANIDRSGNKSKKNEAIQALVALGYSASEAASVVSKVELTEEMEVEDILKTALKNMAFI